MSEEEKVRKAEEILARRNNSEIPYKKEAFKLSRLGKFSIQVIVSICIFGIVYFGVQHNSFAMETIRPLMSTDIDFNKIYNDLSNTWNQIVESRNKKEENTFVDDQNTAGNNDVIVQNDNNNIVENNTLNQENRESEEKKQDNINKQEQETENNNETTSISENKQEEQGIGGGSEKIEESKEPSDIDIIKSNYNFIKPVEGWITSPFGAREPTSIISANHEGIDIGANVGTPIICSMEGSVIEASDYGDYGKHIKIQNNDIITVYAHCSNLFVNVGDYISQGQKIAEVGSTGRSTGPHLHFEIRYNYNAIDPQKILAY